MKITIRPEPENKEFIRTDTDALSLAKNLLEALCVPPNKIKRWNDTQIAEVEPGNNIIFPPPNFWNSTKNDCFFPEALRTDTDWKYSVLRFDGGIMLLLNELPFWAQLHNVNGINHLPENLCNLSFQKLPIYELSPSFKKLHQIKSLDLSLSNNLENIKLLEVFGQLKYLNLSGCEFIENINPLASLTQIQSLDLSNCKSLSGISAIAQMPKLNKLNLRCCKKLSNIKALENIVSIEYLDLFWCEKLIDITPLRSLVQLKSLNISSCESLDNLLPLRNLPKLEILEINDIALIPNANSLGHLPKLTTLTISNCDSIRDVCEIVNRDALHSLNISGNLFAALSNSDIYEFNTINSLKSFEITDGIYVTDIGALKYLTKITRLSISGFESIKDIMPLVDLTRLECLDISYCKCLIDIGVLGKLKNLKVLDISGCELISDITVVDNFAQLETLKCAYCTRLINLPAFKMLTNLRVLDAEFHPAINADILAHCAVSREDWEFVDYLSYDWGNELKSAIIASHPAAFDLANSLAIAFPRISIELSERLCQILQIDASLDYRPWKQLFLGVFQQMGFSTLQNLANTFAAGSWPRGAIGGLAAIAEQLITLADGKEWFAGWVRAISAQHESNPSFLKPVAAPWCMALHCLGENALLDQWIARFTDPDDSSALDAVSLEFGNHRLGLNDAPGAFRHAMRIRATLVRDGLLADIASHYLKAQQADQAAELLFLLSAEGKRAELSLKLADIPHFLDNRDNLHRLLAACGKDAPAIGKLLAKAGMDETAFPSDADDERQRAAQDAAQMASIRTGLDAAQVGELSDLIIQFLKNKAYNL